MLNNLIKFLVIIGLVLVSVSVLVSCGSNVGNPGNTTIPEPKIAFTVYQNGDETTVRSLDSQLPGLDALKEVAARSVSDQSPVAFEVTENNPSNPTTRATMGRYYYKIYWDKHYVGGCIKQNTNHLNLLIRDLPTNKLLFDSHLCVWWNNGPQFGIYNSKNGACSQTPGKFSAIKKKVTDYLHQMTPLPSWAYVPIGYTAAVVIVTAFALSWA